MFYSHIDQFPDSYWDELVFCESHGAIQRYADSNSESVYYCDQCGAVVDDFNDGHECEE